MKFEALHGYVVLILNEAELKEIRVGDKELILTVGNSNKGQREKLAEHMDAIKIAEAQDAILTGQSEPK